MRVLKREIAASARYLGDGIVKADGFINHQLLPGLTTAMGAAFAEAFRQPAGNGATRILTAEVSGIAPALAVAQAMDIPMVFARKKRPAFMTGPLFSARARSRTKAEAVTLFVSAEFIGPEDRVIIIDDFLATASTLLALVEIVHSSGAVLEGVGCIIEKVFEKGREKLSHLDVPIISLARLELTDSGQSIGVI